MAIANLDQKQAIALIDEMASTRNLLAYGIRVIRTGAFIDTTRDPIFTLLSIGVEKLYKLTLGLIALDRDRTWPTKTEMQRQGHKLTVMHQSVMNELRIRATGMSPYVRDLVAEVDNDPVIVPIIDALDAYGRMGRFYYLDELGNDPQQVSPDEFWQEIEQAAFTDLELVALRSEAMGRVNDSDAWDRFYVAFHERIAKSVERLWIMIAVCGRNHALGKAGDVFGFEVHPDAVGRQ